MNNDTAFFSIRTPIGRDQAMKLHPMALAFVGDSVQSLYMRTRVTVGTSNTKTGVLHKEVTAVVKAVAQAAAVEKLLPFFDEDEREVFRLARNCRIQTSAKHAEIGEYRRASGFEAVLGFLYLTGNDEKLAKYLQSSCGGNE